MGISTEKVSRRSALKVMAGAGLGAVAAPMVASTAFAKAITTPVRSATVKLTFWDTNAAAIRTPYWMHLLKQFEAAHKSIQVEYVGIPEAEYVQKIQTAIAGGQVPDVANPGVGDITPFIAQNGLLALDSDFNSWSGKSTMPAKVMASARAVSSNGKLYIIPNSANVNVLYYRKDLFAKIGLTDGPNTWKNLYAGAKMLTDPSKNFYGFGMRGASGSVQTLESWLYAATGITDYFDSKGKSTLNHPSMVAALKKFAALYGKETAKVDLNNSYLQMAAEFDAGHTAMIFHNLGSYPGHVQALGAANVGVSVLPPAPTGKSTLDGQSFLGNVVFQGSQHKKEAWELVAFLSNTASQSYFNQGIGQIPVDKAAATEGWVKKDAAIQAAQNALGSKNVAFVSPPYYLPAYVTTQTAMEPVFQKVLLGQVSSKSFLDQWASMITEAEAQYEKAHGGKKKKKA